MPLAAAPRTVDAWTKACNALSRIDFEQGGISNALRLLDLAYPVARTGALSAQVAQSCVRHVASKYAALRANGACLRRPCVFKEQAVILQGGKRGRDVAFFRPVGVDG